MSRHGRRTGIPALVLLLGGVLVAAPAVPAAGQEAAERDQVERELLQELEGIRHDYERARERAQRERFVRDSVKAARSAKNLDTLSVGPLQVVALPHQADEAREVFADVWSEMRPWIGEDAVDLSDGFFLYDPTREVGGVVLSHHERISGRDWKDFSFNRTMVERNIRIAVAREVSRMGPRALQDWTGGMGPKRAHDEQLPSLYRQLVLTPSIAVQRCVVGEMEGCWAAVGLNPSDHPMREWYTEAQAAMETNRRKGAWEWFSCESARPEARCDEEFFRFRRWATAIPLNPALRADLLAFALERGGEGALERFLDALPPEVQDERGRPVVDHVATAEGIRKGLSAASGLGETALMAAWTERLLSSRPDVQAGADRTRTATFFWIVLLTVFATRSSRWRLG